MVIAKDYRLVDFGDGRKLESFAGFLVDRPCPAANGFAKKSASDWSEADAIFDPISKPKCWVLNSEWPPALALTGVNFRMPVAPTPFGHVGVFPEQKDNWSWIAQQVASSSGLRVLNLFAYTGASSLAALAAGGKVVHVDAAKPNIECAKRAAAFSQLATKPIRYIVEDARKWVARELRRGNHYDLVILDPPAYGHGKSGEAWRLERDLWPLLSACLELFPGNSGKLLITGHSPDIGSEDICRWLRTQLRLSANYESGRAGMRDEHERFLDAGFFVRAVWGDC
jgi:23S rRNA (cytosine1962-C5)-methyltransferase